MLAEVAAKVMPLLASSSTAKAMLSVASLAANIEVLSTSATFLRVSVIFSPVPLTANSLARSVSALRAVRTLPAHVAAS